MAEPRYEQAKPVLPGERLLACRDCGSLVSDSHVSAHDRHHREVPEITDAQRLPQLQPGDSLIIRLGESKVSHGVAAEVEDKARAILRLDESVPVLVLGKDDGLEVLPPPCER